MQQLDLQERILVEVAVALDDFYVVCLGCSGGVGPWLHNALGVTLLLRMRRILWAVLLPGSKPVVLRNECMHNDSATQGLFKSKICNQAKPNFSKQSLPSKPEGPGSHAAAGRRLRGGQLAAAVAATERARRRQHCMQAHSLRLRAPTRGSAWKRDDGENGSRDQIRLVDIRVTVTKTASAFMEAGADMAAGEQTASPHYIGCHQHKVSPPGHSHSSPA